MVKKQKSAKSEIEKLAELISGEVELKKKEEKLEDLKKQAVKRQKNIRRLEVVTGDTVLEKDDVTDKKIVQKVKLYEWEAPMRFKYPFNIKTFFIILTLCLLFVVYLAVLGNYGLMAAVLALLFFVYITGTIPPVSVKHTLTARGIDTMGKLYEWYMLDSFWFAKKEDQYLLVIDTKLRIPGRLLLIATKEELDALFVLLQDKLLYKDIRKQGWLEKQTYGKYIKLEDI